MCLIGLFSKLILILMFLVLEGRNAEYFPLAQEFPQKATCLRSKVFMISGVINRYHFFTDISCK